MYRLATKRIAKKRTGKRRKCVYGLRLTRLSKRHGSFVNNDTVQWSNGATAACRCSRGVRTSDCGRRSAVIVGSADWQRTYFLFRGRDVAIAMNSVKILHAVRSAITAIAELLVTDVFDQKLVPYCSSSCSCSWSSSSSCGNLFSKMPKARWFQLWSGCNLAGIFFT